MILKDVEQLETVLENSCSNDFTADCFVNFMAYVDELPTIQKINKESLVKEIMELFAYDSCNNCQVCPYWLSYCKNIKKEEIPENSSRCFEAVKRNVIAIINKNIV